ncbi:predicted protein, partial [Nematostella vectensis]
NAIENEDKDGKREENGESSSIVSIKVEYPDGNDNWNITNVPDQDFLSSHQGSSSSLIENSSSQIKLEGEVLSVSQSSSTFEGYHRDQILDLSDNSGRTTPEKSDELDREDSSPGLRDVSPRRRHSPINRRAWGDKSYFDLIAEAIEPSPCKAMTIKDIYRWFSDNIPELIERGDYQLEGRSPHFTEGEKTWRAAEKALKAAQFSLDATNVRIHDLHMIASCLDDSTLSSLAVQLEGLVGNSMRMRYPDCMNSLHAYSIGHGPSQALDLAQGSRLPTQTHHI